MITLYSGPTPNGRKISIALEEMGLAYTPVYVDILEGDQHKPEFLKLNPNNKFPVIVDHKGPGEAPFVLWESGAILIYLAEKTGRFLPEEPAARYRCLQWIMFQMAGVGPMFGQFAHFFYYAKDKHPYALDRYGKEMQRLLRVMDEHLAANAYFAGEVYSIADMCVLPWVGGAVDNPALPPRPHLKRWADALRERPAVRRGLDCLREKVRPEIVEGGMKGFGDEHRSQLFGEAQHRRNLG